MSPRLTAPLLALLLALPSCHLIFRYEDRADSGAPTPDLHVLQDGAPDLPTPQDGAPDRARPDAMRPDGGVPDRGVKPDKPGPTWTVLKPPTQSTIYGLWGMNEYEVYLVGGNSTIIRYSGGAKFTSAKLSVPVTFYGVTRKGSSEIVVVGYQAAVRVCDRGTLKCTLADPTSGSAASREKQGGPPWHVRRGPRPGWQSSNHSSRIHVDRHRSGKASQVPIHAFVCRRAAGEHQHARTVVIRFRDATAV